MRVYLSMGSNVGDAAAQLRLALELLGRQGCRVLRVSSFYRTEPVPPAPKQPWFINCAAEAETELSPHGLMRTAKALESYFGPRRTAPGEPRAMDIDILFYQDVVLKSPGLKIPHPRLSERRFVLIPLKELAPKLRHPVSKKTVSQMLRETADRSRVERI